MTIEQITHDLASIDRVLYRPDLFDRFGLHGRELGAPKKTTLIDFGKPSVLPTDEEWASRLTKIKAAHRPSFTVQGWCA